MSILHKHSGRSSTHTEQQLPVGHGPAHVQHPWPAAVVALVLGMAAAAAGAGVGIRHLQKAGLTLETLIGLTLLAVGLVLLGYAATAGWRALQKWWRLALLPAAVVVVLVTFSGAMAVMYAVVPPTALGPGTPAYSPGTDTACS